MPGARRRRRLSPRALTALLLLVALFGGIAGSFTVDVRAQDGTEIDSTAVATATLPGGGGNATAGVGAGAVIGTSVAFTAAGVVLVGAGVRSIHHAPAPSSATMAAPPIAIGNSGGPSPDERPLNPGEGVRWSG